jgi:hypothetical protein
MNTHHAIYLCLVMLLTSRSQSLAQSPLIRPTGQGHTEAASGCATRPPTLPNGFEKANAAAARAADGTPDSVRGFVDETFNRSTLRRAPESVRQRVTKAELQFHQGKRKGISNESLARAVNDSAIAFGAPDTAKTSVAQIHLVRMLIAQEAPNVGQTWDPERLVCTDLMTPSQAVFVALFLLDQKLLNPDYQLDPDKWSARERKRQVQMTDMNPKDLAALHGARARSAKPTPYAHRVAGLLAGEQLGEVGVVTLGVHRTLDSLGLER